MAFCQKTSKKIEWFVGDGRMSTIKALKVLRLFNENSGTLFDKRKFRKALRTTTFGNTNK